VDSMDRYHRRYKRLQMLSWNYVVKKMECREEEGDYIVSDEQQNTLERVNLCPIHSQKYSYEVNKSKVRAMQVR